MSFDTIVLVTITTANEAHRPLFTLVLDYTGCTSRLFVDLGQKGQCPKLFF